MSDAGTRERVTVTATLPVPPGINRSYATTRFGGFYTSKPAKDWATASADHLRLECGWRRVDESMPGVRVLLAVEYHLYVMSNGQDIDAGIKATLDLIARVLGVDDKCVCRMVAYRTVIRHRAERRLDLRVKVMPIEPWPD